VVFNGILFGSQKTSRQAAANTNSHNNNNNSHNNKQEPSRREKVSIVRPSSDSLEIIIDPVEYF
jgi:hypothetical protein